MSRILVFTASGRADSVSTRLAQLAGTTAEAQGHEVQYFDLSRGIFSCCKGCGYCRSHDGCSIGDGLFPLVTGCDGIIAGFPIYFSGVAGQGKALLDRLYPMMDASFVPRHPGKKVLAIYAQGDPREGAFAPAIGSANYVFRMCGWQLVDSILCTGTSQPGYTIPEAITRKVISAAERL